MKIGSRNVILSTLVLAAGLTGCSTYSLQKLRHTTPQGTPFQNALSKLYMDFAAQEEKDYDWFNSMHFADKGLLAAYGKEVGPENLKDWDIPSDVLPDMQKAREALVAALTPSVLEARPELAAEAQFNFDCWAEQQDENWQVDDIARCRDGLNDALDQIAGRKTVAKMSTTPAAAAEAMKETPKAEAKPIAEEALASDYYVVFFEHTGVELTQASKQTLDDIVKSLANQSDYEIILGGPSDKATAKLLQQRVDAVKKQLVSSGINPAVINPVKVETQSHKPVARRVSITLNE